MKEKITVLTLCAMLLALWASAEAQQAAKVPRLGYLSGGSSHTGTNPNAFWQGLREFGYVEGKNIRFEYGLAERKLDQKWPPSYLLVYADARIVTGVRGRRRSANADRRSDGRAADSWIAPARHRGDFAPGKARHALADALHDLRVTAPTCLQTRRRQGADPRLGQQPAVVRRFILGASTSGRQRDPRAGSAQQFSRDRERVEL
jgi:hypothetical protein